MKLSVIIVNYNVEHFLEQCLHSVRAALKNVSGDIYVVDNNSVDGSVQMVKEKFPEVHVIANKENLGFSKANNQALQIAKGEYVLLLNPDTVVEEDTFRKVVAFMDEHTDAGGLGVYMIDGKGNFLPESKRGLPTPSVAFWKMCGLAKLFPSSQKFGRYHLGYLDRNKTHEIEILSGAFMLMRKSALDKVGLLDEDYFMYGEDIDLSYRLLLGGYKNYYFPGTKIIHYKGESTKKSSVNYVFVFYRAMVIFAKKHFSSRNARLFSTLINFAIWLRAGAAILSRFIKALALPLFDLGILLGGHYLITRLYAENFKFGEGGTYSENLVRVLLPAYSLIWLFSVYFSGGYDKPIRLTKIIRGLFVGTAANLVMYALLPEEWRFSRAIILLGAGWALASLLLSRLVFSLMPLKGMKLESGNSQRIAIVGSPEECKRVNALIRQTSANISFAGFVNAKDENINDSSFIGRYGQLSDVVTIYGIDEVIFCAKDIDAKDIIDRMSQLGDSKKVSYKIAPPESLSIIGSNSIDTAGDLYVIDINSVSKPVNRRNKRVLDFGLSLFFIGTFPVSMWLAANPFGFFGNMFAVLFGTKTWVGYSEASDGKKLPRLRKSVVCPADVLKSDQRSKDICERLDLLYAKDYRSSNDLNIIRKSIRSLGN